MLVDKLSHAHQDQWTGKRNLYDRKRLKQISKNVKINKDIESTVSSAASCVNVFGSLSKDDLKNYLNTFNLGIEEIISFPSPVNLSGEVYNDTGDVVFEWIGPRKSPIEEGSGGQRGDRRTSVDAYIIVKIDSIVTQLLIEWKFTEEPNNKNFFAGIRGNERLRRYSTVLAKLRKKKDFPFMFSDDGGMGLNDFGYDTFYQMMRMTLLAKMTTPIQLDDLIVEDYRFIHLTHSENNKINIIDKAKVKHFPTLHKYIGKSVHETWTELLSDSVKKKSYYGHWDKGLSVISDPCLKKYLSDRYVQ